ncbi:MAG: beta-ketoacyl synthase chain length factor [Comamonadaceae bacterium]|nr:beta-ketoacyl synthase chain length factor [Comamonadaceae bacterium]RRD58786.1 3-oxoacyl-ACP synthase [Comamonadaceae bacterium OH2545_COT-014]
MSSFPALCAWVDGVGVLAPGIDGWPQARALLRGEQSWASAPTALPAPEGLAGAERRRASRIVKAALAAGLQACAQAGHDAAALPAVFASSGGDGHNCHALCEQLAMGDVQISPTRFHNSVHNAASGYWGIATGATPAAQVLAAHDASFAAGLLEALAQVSATGQPVLLLACDSEYPEPLHAKRPIADTAALALVLAPARSARSLAALRLPCHGALAEAPATALAALAPHADAALAQAMFTMPPLSGLPLLAALAVRPDLAASVPNVQGSPAPPAGQTVALAYLPPQTLRLEVTPP